MMICLLVLTACGSEKAADKSEGKDSTTEKNTEVVTDTTTEANKEEVNVDQMAAPAPSDEVAVMNIEGYGDVKIRFFPEVAPKAVENFITLSKDGYYDGLIFHRVISNFMIQGGDPTGTGAGGESCFGDVFENEVSDQLMCLRGALCMANSGPDTNGSQFFIEQQGTEDMDNYFTGNETEEQKTAYKEYGGSPWLQGSYTVFGQVFEGMDIVDEIAKVETDSSDKPVTDVKIAKVTITTYDQASAQAKTE